MDLSIPVREFLKQNLSTVEKVEGLLKYGYSKGQIIVMLDSSNAYISKIMQEHGFKELDMHGSIKAVVYHE